MSRETPLSRFREPFILKTQITAKGNAPSKKISKIITENYFFVNEIEKIVEITQKNPRNFGE